MDSDLQLNIAARFPTWEPDLVVRAAKLIEGMAAKYGLPIHVVYSSFCKLFAEPMEEAHG